MKSRIILYLLFLFTACDQKPYYIGDFTESGHQRIDSLIEPSAALDSIIKPYRDTLTQVMSRVIGNSDTTLERGKPEGNLGKLMADIALRQTKKKFGIQADICLLNHGGIRAPLAAGEITVGEIYGVMPFENELVVITLPGSALADLVAYVIHTGGQPVSGISIDAGKSDPSILINGHKLEDKKEYHVVTTDYLAAGGDKMDFWKKGTARKDLRLKLRDAMIDYIEQQTAQGKTIQPDPTPRIILIANEKK